jgi:hypothetical protein
MRVKSRVLVGLIVLIVLVSGVSLVKRLSQEKDLWRPSDVYKSVGIHRRSTFSTVSSAPASYSEAVATVSSGSGSMFRHSGAFFHAPVSGSAYSQSPMAGTASYSQRLHTTSSAEIRSFGGGGNGGGVSMSGGVAKSSGSGAGSSVSLGVSTPSAPILAVNSNRNSNISVLPNISGEVVANPVATYAGIGNTTGGTSRGISGRKNGAVEDSWLDWLYRYGNKWGSESGDDQNGYTYSFSYNNLLDAYNDYVTNYWQKMWGDPPTFDEWLTWFQGNGGSHDYKGNTYSWVPVGDYYPLLILAMLYVGYVAIRRRKSKISENNI